MTRSTLALEQPRDIESSGHQVRTLFKRSFHTTLDSRQILLHCINTMNIPSIPFMAHGMFYLPIQSARGLWSEANSD